ncbi:serine hydrolase [Paenibacillus sp. JX-17]|uniref:Serine hydrolase n=1 Tax=Paenibacillus lacisoli TaxID=3064525 RepID=A0ABT9CKU6_9BACL|nr:serine hydrolase [Paenibacillus sp. JX-17]MDO7908291.1 serine hydrolase [Paenibacillus sp. JX-17]
MADFRFPRAVPETVGIHSAGIEQFIHKADGLGQFLHSLMVLRHGQVAAEAWWSPYQSSYKHAVYSLTKSFTSSAIGIAAHEGLLNIEDLVVSFFPEYLTQAIPDLLGRLTVRYLLMMAAGQDEDANQAMLQQPDGDWAAAFFGIPVTHEPGTRFIYNSGASYMLSAIVQRAAGQSMEQYLQTRLFEPLGITDYEWASCPRGKTVGGWGLKLRTEDTAKFGQLYLQRGWWNGRSLIPEAWVDEASTFHVETGTEPDHQWHQGYGYQFWLCRSGAYRADGAFGQMAIVLPHLDAVVVFTAGSQHTELLLNTVWDQLLSAFTDQPLPPAPANHASLQRTLAALSYPPAQGSNVPTPMEWTGKVYRFPPNPVLETLQINDDGQDRLQLLVTGEQGIHRLTYGRGAWLAVTSSLFNYSGVQGASSICGPLMPGWMTTRWSCCISAEKHHSITGSN